MSEVDTVMKGLVEIIEQNEEIEEYPEKLLEDIEEYLYSSVNKYMFCFNMIYSDMLNAS